MKYLCWLSLLFCLSACGGVFNSAADITIEARATSDVGTAQAMGTQAPTMQAMQATADQAAILATQIGQMTRQNINMQGTISAVSAVTNLQAPAANPAQQPTPIPQQQPAQNPAAPPGATAIAPPPGMGQPASNPTPQSAPQQDAAPSGGPTAIAPPPGQVFLEVTPQELGADTMDSSLNSSAGTRFSDTTTASSINAANGCATDAAALFSPNAREIYFTTLARNVVQGATYRVDWKYEGATQFSSSPWTANEAFPEICVWFYANGPFEVGAWTAELVENENVVTTAAFTIRE